MKSSLDCIPCFLRQALDAARMASKDEAIHEQILREVLAWCNKMDLKQSPPVMGQRIHRRLRELTGVNDPYRQAKMLQNRLVLGMLPELRAVVEASPDPLATAVKLAIAGNVIDMGANGKITEGQVRSSIQQGLSESVTGDWEMFVKEIGRARRILYLADNAGEIVLDRLVVEQLLPKRVTVAVRGAPILNDVTISDVSDTGLQKVADVIDNGSDVPGTLLSECSREFRRRFANTDMIISKGQGNFETLSDESFNIFFMFKAKCPVIAEHARVPLGAHILVHSGAGAEKAWKRSHEAAANTE